MESAENHTETTAAGCSIGVSIVAHRTPTRQLGEALACICRCPLVETVEIIDNSPDNALRCYVAGLAREEPRIHYRHTANRGYGAGHNLAMRESLAAGRDYHLVMNADVSWQGDVIAAMADFMNASPATGLSMPRVRYPDGTLQYACRMLPTPFDVFAKRFLPAALIRRRMRRYLMADADHSATFGVAYLLGSFLFFRVSALERCGLFDERFFMYPEDIDISRRLSECAGAVFFGGAEIVHHHQAASRRSGRMLRIHLVNMARYFNKWGWIFDRGRRRLNRRVLASMPRAAVPERGRG